MAFIGSAVGNVLGGVANGLSPGQQHGGVATAATGDQAKKAYEQQQAALEAQRSFLMALQNQGGIGNQTSVFQQQQALANALQAQAMGTGPNPVQAQLAQATGANTANQAALMAGQRGASANAGLMARQAANVGANNQQAMNGQAATLGAQQQLAAQQALMQQQGQMAALSTQQVGQQADALQTQGNMALQGQSNVLNALTNQNQMNAGIEAGNIGRRNQIVGGLLQGGASMATMGVTGGKAMAQPSGVQGGAVPNMGGGMMVAAKGGMAGFDGMVQSGPRSAVGRYFMSQGGTVPGAAPVHGDSLSNDTIPAMLSPGEIVVPRSVLQGKNPADAAKKFVEAVLAKNGNLALAAKLRK